MSFDKKQLDLHLLPDEPGVYRFFNEEEVLIYVGKAKSVKKRVGSYFNKIQGLNLKTRRLSQEIRKIEYTLTNNEFDALLLENNLIKENQPKYNILLKDDKSFPYIAILKERFPRIISTRKYNPKTAEYFGPYTSVVAMKSVLDLITKLYTIRTCNYNLSEENIKAKKFKVCLEYHIGNCLGPCEGLQTEEDYKRDIEQARHILKGNLGIVKQHFKDQMKLQSGKMAFELAQKYKDKLDLLEKFHARATVVNPKLSNIDIITIISDEKRAYLNFMQISSGAIVVTRNIEVKKKLEESDEQLLLNVLIHFRDLVNSSNKTILSNKEIILLPDDWENYVPKIGDKRKLVELSLKNALEFKKEKILRAEPKKKRVLVQLQQDLQLKDYPDHIECFDNSNFQGTDPVASMVCFKDGKPSKADYRRFNIKTVVGSDDFASMKEIVFRRYYRLIAEDQPLPKLIVIDGGKGQLSKAVEALEDLEIRGKIPIIGIAKRLEEIYFPDDSLPLHISKRSSSLQLIQKLRDEAHRFAITFHRQKRSKSTFKTELESIEGIGRKKADQLLKHFKSVSKVSKASEEDISSVIGSTAGKRVYQYFNQ